MEAATTPRQLSGEKAARIVTAMRSSVAQRGVAGSTYETYRSALRLRRESGLGSGGMEWLHGLGDDVIAFVNRDVLVVANLGTEPVAVPAGAEPLLASVDTVWDTDGTVLVPSDATVWARFTD